MELHELDEADRRILRELQRDGALRNDVLADRIALTPAPTLRRVRALEKAGVISRYAALLDAERVGFPVRVKVDVRLASQTRNGIDAFSKAIMAMPQVIECMILFGEWDYVLTVVARDVDDYRLECDHHCHRRRAVCDRQRPDQRLCGDADPWSARQLVHRRVCLAGGVRYF